MDLDLDSLGGALLLVLGPCLFYLLFGDPHFGVLPEPELHHVVEIQWTDSGGAESLSRREVENGGAYYL